MGLWAFLFGDSEEQDHRPVFRMPKAGLGPTVSLIGAVGAGKSALVSGLLQRHVARIVAGGRDGTHDETAHLLKGGVRVLNTPGYGGELHATFASWSKTLHGAHFYVHVLNGSGRISDLDTQVNRTLRRDRRPFMVAITKEDTLTSDRKKRQWVASLRRRIKPKVSRPKGRWKERENFLFVSVSHEDPSRTRTESCRELALVIRSHLADAAEWKLEELPVFPMETGGSRQGS